MDENNKETDVKSGRKTCLHMS